jgi:hypothetical protein
MTTATITPLPGGKALLSFRGAEELFPSLQAAINEARAHTFPFEVLPFPALPIDIIAISPAVQP